MSSRSFSRGGAVAAAVLVLNACADPTGVRSAAPGPLVAKAPGGGQVPAAVEWNAVARGLVAKNRSNVFVAFRVYALTSVAQQRAVVEAEQASQPGSRPSVRAAIAAASAAVLADLYPADAGALAARAAQQLSSNEWLEEGRTDVAAGEAAGKAVAASVLADARTDGYSDAWTGTIPTGPGMWYSNGTPPAGATLTDARPWFLTSPDQFRPAPPPAFGSPEFLAALAEVRRISDTRTQEQDSIARFWAMGGGTHTPPGHWNAEASALAVRYSLNERRAAELLALMNMAAVDAIIASNDAKYTYWLLRPSQADPAITLSISPLPNFPAYPSNHATISSAMAEIIAAHFPSEARRLRAAAEEASLSRVYGGIHYRFDGDAGLELGRQVARWALEQAREGGAP